MDFRAPCKINLGLRVVGRRADGFHDIETVMMAVGGLCDTVSVSSLPFVSTTPPPYFAPPSVIPERSVLEVTSARGMGLDCPPEENICMRALRLLQDRFGIGEARVRLHKEVPSGAGLGGGSSDAAATLLAADKEFALELTAVELESLGAELGSDVPFFLRTLTAERTDRKGLFGSGRRTGAGGRIGSGGQTGAGTQTSVGTQTGVGAQTGSGTYTGVRAQAGSGGQTDSDTRTGVVAQLCTGRGEVMTPIELDLGGLWLVISRPEGVVVSTAEAYRGVVPREGCGTSAGPGADAGPDTDTDTGTDVREGCGTGAGTSTSRGAGTSTGATRTTHPDAGLSLPEILARPVEEWKGLLVNDFEESVTARHPAIGVLIQTFYDAGALYASMSGSGSAVYGLFERRPHSLPAIASCVL